MSSNASVQDLLSDPKSVPFRSAPIWLVWSDARLFASRIIPHFLDIFLPIPSGRGIFTDITVTGLFFQIILTIYSILLFIPLVILGILIGGLTPILVAYASAWPFLVLQGTSLVQISIRNSTVKESNRSLHSKESWLFINGVSTSRSGLVLILQRLETLFQRPVTGIHNRTLGPIIDLLECIVQRDINYSTRDVRAGYIECKRRLQDTNVKKVVLLCHSQGGIIASLVVDELLNDLNLDQLDKLEVYTFANAANHFSNPELSLNNRKYTIRHIEHYANGKDPISQIGVLAFANVSGGAVTIQTKDKKVEDPPTTSNVDLRFQGRLFVRWRMSGHLLLSH
jgi:hypothetical protein